MSHPLDSVVYISVPEGAEISAAIPSFDPSIPLPVQLSAPMDNLRPEERPDSSTLRPEMILAGILTVFAYDPENAHAEYYRTIIKTLHPDIAGAEDVLYVLAREDRQRLAYRRGFSMHIADQSYRRHPDPRCGPAGSCTGRTVCVRRLMAWTPVMVIEPIFPFTTGGTGCDPEC